MATNQNLIITSKGLAAITSANDGGFKLSIKTFKVTSYVYATTDTLADTLKGTPFYTGVVSSVEVLSETSVRYELTIPVGVPTSGASVIGEVGLYLDSGELFAVGKVLPSISKDSTTGFSIYTIVAGSKLGGVVDVTVSEKANLSRTNADLLPDPKSSGANVLAVTDAHRGYPSPYPSAGLAIKFGATDDE